jgi:hypothetical protein
MMSRNVRWMGAGVAALVALCAAPSRSSADVQILVEELSGGSVVSSQYSTGTPTNGSVTFSISLPSYLGSGTVTSTSALGGTPSLTPSFSGVFTTSGINNGTAATDTIRITVTDDGYKTNGTTGTLKNQAATSNGISGGGEQVNTFSQIFSSPLSTPASSTSALATGSAVTGVTATASAASPANAALTQLTQENVSNLPSNFAIQQTLVVSFAQNSGETLSGTFGGSGGAFIVPNVAAVPAPGGLALALIGLPLLGLRRTLRKRAAA